jgi:hypothetical protein
MKIEWNSKFVAAEAATRGGVKKIILKGVLIDTTENKNQWMVEAEDFESLSKNFIGKQIRVDHSERVSDVKGVITNTEVDGPHQEAKADWDPANQNEHIHYFGEIASTDDNVIIPLKMGYVSHVSPAVDAKTLLCSICKEPMIDRFVRSCKCEGGAILLKDISPRELSIVASPAYENTVMTPYGFGAACDAEFLTKDKILHIINDEMSKRGLI